MLPTSFRQALTSRFAVGVVIAYVALALAMLALYWWPEAKALAGDEVNYQHRALGLLAGGDRHDPALIWPPLQWLLMALVYKLAGPHILAVQLLQLLLLAMAGFLLRQIVWRLTGSAAAGNWAGVLLAVNPLTVAFATYLWPEIAHLFFSLVLAFALVRLWRGPGGERKRPLPGDWRWALWAGAALGLCLLGKSLLTGFWPLLLLPLVDRFDVAGSLRRVLVFALAALVVTGPALHHGWQLTGRPVIADSSWFNLWVGLQDRWRSDFVFDQTGERMREYLQSSDDPAQRVEFAQARVRAIVAEQGPVATVAGQLSRQYFRLFDSRQQLVAQLPGPACLGYQSRYHLADGVVARTVDAVARAWHLLLLGLFAFGLAAWRDWRAPWLWLTAAFVGYQLALLLGLHVKTRFLLPMLPVVCLFAGHLLARMFHPRSASAADRRAATPGPTPLSVGRRRAGIALATLLMILALAGPALDRACSATPAEAGDVTGPGVSPGAHL